MQFAFLSFGSQKLGIQGLLGVLEVAGFVTGRENFAIQNYTGPEVSYFDIKFVISDPNNLVFQAL